MLSQLDLATTINRLASEIANDVADLNPVFVGLLKGSLIFMSDLIRQLNFPLTTDFLSVSSYQGTTSTGLVRILNEVEHPIANRHVILVEDIVDSGQTVHHVIAHLRLKNPASIRICSLLDKTARRLTPVAITYIGHQFTDGFVVGFGMDYQGYYRNLPYVGIIKGASENPSAKPDP